MAWRDVGYGVLIIFSVKIRLQISSWYACKALHFALGQLEFSPSGRDCVWSTLPQGSTWAAWLCATSTPLQRSWAVYPPDVKTLSYGIYLTEPESNNPCPVSPWLGVDQKMAICLRCVDACKAPIGCHEPWHARLPTRIGAGRRYLDS